MHHSQERQTLLHGGPLLVHDTEKNDFTCANLVPEGVLRIFRLPVAFVLMLVMWGVSVKCAILDAQSRWNWCRLDS